MIKRLGLALLLVCICSVAYGAGLDDDTLMYLPFNEGPDGSTTCDDITDRHDGDITFNVDAELGTAITKYAGDTSSLLLDGTGDYVGISDSADFDIFGATNESWTIDFWFKWQVVGNDVLIAQNADSGNFWQLYNDASGFRFYGKSGGAQKFYDQSTRLNNTNWNHCAIVNINGSLGVYINGTQTHYASLGSGYTVSAELGVGINTTAADYFEGNIAHLRIQKSNYFSASPQNDDSDTITPPTEEYSYASTASTQIIVVDI